MVSEPDTPLLPDQSPEAVQLVASVEFQFSVVDPFWETVTGFAEKESVGAGAATVTLTESFALPPAPLQVRLKVLFEVSALMAWEPDVALFPVQSPEAVQPLVLLLLQLNVVEPL